MDVRRLLEIVDQCENEYDAAFAAATAQREADVALVEALGYPDVAQALREAP